MSTFSTKCSHHITFSASATFTKSIKEEEYQKTPFDEFLSSMDKMKNYELTAKIWANINEMRFFARRTEIFRTEIHWMAAHLGSFNHFHAFLITWFEFRSYLIHKIQSTSKMQYPQRTSFRFFHIFWMVSLIEPLFSFWKKLFSIGTDFSDEKVVSNAQMSNKFDAKHLICGRPKFWWWKW